MLASLYACLLEYLLACFEVTDDCGVVLFAQKKFINKAFYVIVFFLQNIVGGTPGRPPGGPRVGTNDFGVRGKIIIIYLTSRNLFCHHPIQVNITRSIWKADLPILSILAG